MMQQMQIGDICIKVVRKDIKHMHLGVYPPAGAVRLTAPHLTPDDSLRLFAISKLGWIKRQQRSFVRQARETAREYVSGESHYYQGKRYLLEVLLNGNVPKVVVLHKRIQLMVPVGYTQEQRRGVMERWYRRQLRQQARPIVEAWVQKLGVGLDDWGIKQMRTKWGSCRIEAKRIWLNLELAKKPPRCLEYIIVHELIHLLERHHNDRFQSLISTHIPNWQSIKDELNALPVCEW